MTNEESRDLYQRSFNKQIDVKSKPQSSNKFVSIKVQESIDYTPFEIHAVNVTDELLGRNATPSQREADLANANRRSYVNCISKKLECTQRIPSTTRKSIDVDYCKSSTSGNGFNKSQVLTSRERPYANCIGELSC